MCRHHYIQLLISPVVSLQLCLPHVITYSKLNKWPFNKLVMSYTVNGLGLACDMTRQSTGNCSWHSENKYRCLVLLPWEGSGGIWFVFKGREKISICCIDRVVICFFNFLFLFHFNIYSFCLAFFLVSSFLLSSFPYFTLLYLHHSFGFCHSFLFCSFVFYYHPFITFICV